MQKTLALATLAAFALSALAAMPTLLAALSGFPLLLTRLLLAAALLAALTAHLVLLSTLLTTLILLARLLFVGPPSSLLRGVVNAFSQTRQYPVAAA